MSYILDALRRAEADRERERGQVPGLHTQAPSGPGAAASTRQRRWLPWAAGGLLLLAGIGAGSWWTSGAPQTPSPALPPSTQPAPVPPAITSSTPVAAAPLPLPPAAASAAESPFLPPAPPPQAMAPRPAATEQLPAPKAAPTEAAPPRLADLPENFRRELPRLAISGSVYSEDPAGRFVIINGEVQREGAKLGADLLLEQIGPRELVLRFRGQRFRQPV
ncbi:general secretion pathway protein GspB [Roseateles asaccharophilus]|uniref:General secretion pathway protein B n=1 Tax=Roseateles asaccharophilus TaxID=582607 RepID=A0ABU2A5W8_9BURK|nr:general secretion pathway protein GspB [Roseateles asaccharophilus]MDR7332597.1 general secretion pathway protein B [Roseateles asaccharophilus]